MTFNESDIYKIRTDAIMLKHGNDPMLLWHGASLEAFVFRLMLWNLKLEERIIELEERLKNAK